MYDITFKVQFEVDDVEWKDKPDVAVISVGDVISSEVREDIALRKCRAILRALNLVKQVRWEFNRTGQGHYLTKSQWYDWLRGKDVEEWNS